MPLCRCRYEDVDGQLTLTMVHPDCPIIHVDRKPMTDMTAPNVFERVEPTETTNPELFGMVYKVSFDNLDGVVRALKENYLSNAETWFIYQELVELLNKMSEFGGELFIAVRNDQDEYQFSFVDFDILSSTLAMAVESHVMDISNWTW